MFKYLYSFLFLLLFVGNNLMANCPGCVVDVPQGMAEDTLFLGVVPDGMAGFYYDNDVSFRMPKTTTPVNQTDPDIPAGLEINEITLIGISNLPPGLSWEANQTNYDPQDETDGCIKFCGTPLFGGLYVMEVTVEASIFVVTEQVTFPMEIYIEPAVAVNDGFTLINNSGCGEVTVTFQNNVPSNGENGYSYLWNFGNGNSSLDENPETQTYTQPGTYVVDYQAVIDTFGFLLNKVIIEDVSCNDIPTFPDFSNNPDMQIEVIDPNGVKIYESDTIWNTDPPIEFYPNLFIEPGQYQMRVIDADSGINGGDDICAEFNFNQYSDGTSSTNEWAVNLEILHPVDTINSSDTVTVFAVPDQPTIFNSGAAEFCEGEMITLTSSYAINNQWYKDSLLLDGEVFETLDVAESGIYQVEYTTIDGCTAISEALTITIFDNPPIPEFDNVNNLLELLDNIDYNSNHAFQWQFNGVVLVDETMPLLCAEEDGIYTLEMTDLTTGCISVYTADVDYDEMLDCNMTSAEELANAVNLNIYPNPADDWINIELSTSDPVELEIRIYNLLGKQNSGEGMSQQLYGANFQERISVAHLPAGIHFVELQIGEERIIRKIIKQ